MLSTLAIHAPRCGVPPRHHAPGRRVCGVGASTFCSTAWICRCIAWQSQFRVMPLDGNEDLSVGRQRFVGTTRGLQGFLPYRFKNLDDRRHQPLQGRIVGGPANGQMKRGIAIHRGGVPVDLLFLLGANLLQAQDIRRCGAFGGQGRDTRLDQTAHFKQVDQRILATR